VIPAGECLTLLDTSFSRVASWIVYGLGEECSVPTIGKVSVQTEARSVAKGQNLKTILLDNSNNVMIAFIPSCLDGMRQRESLERANSTPVTCALMREGETLGRRPSWDRRRVTVLVSIIFMILAGLH